MSDRMNKVFFVSVPKSGTHMLMLYFNLVGFAHVGQSPAAVYLAPDSTIIEDIREGEVTAWHERWNPQVVKRLVDNQVHVVFLYRDPRGQACSLMHWLMRDEGHALHRAFMDDFPSTHERLSLIISGGNIAGQQMAGISQVYSEYRRWLDEPFVFPLRFEDIIGPSGGGSRERQLSVLRDLMAFTGAAERAPEPEQLADMLFGNQATTFRKGQIDSWKEEFTPELHEMLLQEFNGVLDLWGYDPKESLKGL